MSIFSAAALLLMSCGGFGAFGQYHEADIATPCHDVVEVTVTHVVDGDTIDVSPGVELDGETIERFRFLCIDTPESTTEHECYGEESKEFLRDMLEGEQVQLIFDADCTGVDGRGLVYVRHGNDLVNDTLARQGYAPMIEDWFADYTWCPAIQEAMEQAREEDLGGWGECSGDPWQ